MMNRTSKPKMRKGWLQAVLRRVGLDRRANVKMGSGPTSEAPRRTATTPTCRMRRRAHRMAAAEGGE